MFVIPLLGELKPRRDIPEWQVSQPIPVSFFAGTALEFIIEADADSPDVHAAIERVLSLGEADRLDASTPVFENYRAFLEASDLEPLDIATPTKVWQYVTPTAIHVKRRHRRDRDIYVALMCECEWEPEHGLQLVFRGGKRLVRVSDQDGHLTRADAYNLPDDQDPGMRT